MGKITGKRPNMFTKSGSKVGRRAIASMSNEILNELQHTASQIDNVYIKRMPNYLIITEQKLESQGVVDLKKAFATSPKKKQKKGGGWYLIIPIRLKTSNMRSGTYNALNNLKITGGSKTIKTNYIEELQKKNITHFAMIPDRPSRNTTKVKKRKQSRASYFMFRTVSANSPASSWILNRDKVNSDNFSKTTLKNVEKLMNWKMKNIIK